MSDYGGGGAPEEIHWRMISICSRDNGGPPNGICPPMSSFSCSIFCNK